MSVILVFRLEVIVLDQINGDTDLTIHGVNDVLENSSYIPQPDASKYLSLVAFPQMFSDCIARRGTPALAG